MKFLFFLFLFACQGAWAGGGTDNKVHWAITDFPPFLVLDSEEATVDIKKARGPFAEVYRDLVKALPQYEHSFIRASFLRAEKLFSMQKHFCTLLLQKTPDRERYLIFGAEVARALPIGLVLNSSQFPLYKRYVQNDEVDLVKLIGSNGFRLGVVSGRSYSGSIDTILGSATNSFQLVSDKAAGSLFTMLENKRLDGVLSYVLEANDYSKANTSADFHFLMIKQGPPFISVRVSCEKSDWGKELIPVISKVITEKNVRKKIYDYFLANLPENMKRKYKENYRMPLQ